MFDYKHYGNIVFWPSEKWADKPRSDLIVFDITHDTAELNADLVIGKDVSKYRAHSIRSMIIKYWDYSCKQGARRTILDYKFAIDTGESPLVCCRKSTYVPNEALIIMAQMDSLLLNR